MSNLVLSMITTLDGFISGPDGELNWIIADDELHDHANDEMRSASAFICGRGMYQVIFPYWDNIDPSDSKNPRVVNESAAVFQATPRVVISRTLESVDNMAILIRSHVAEEIESLKLQHDRDLILSCGPELLATLAQHDLVDEYRLLISPVALGQGKALFSGMSRQLNLRLIDARPFTSGVVLHRYRPA